MRISLVIPVRNGGRTLAACLASSNESSRLPDEIVVVDDGSSDESNCIAADSGVLVLRQERSLGPAAARNLGARHTTGEILLFLDADVLLHRDTIDLVLRRFAADPGLDALFGSYDDSPTQRNFSSRYRNLLHHWVHQHSREETGSFWAGCGALRRETFLAAGGFNEGFGTACIEDIELGSRLHAAGRRVLLCKEIQVTHMKRWSPALVVKTDVLHRAVPWTRLILSSRHLPNDLNLQTSSRLSGLAALVLAGCLAVLPFGGGQYALGGAAAAAALLLVLNLPLYSFFFRREGGCFAFAAVLAHWAYFLYSTLTFAFVLCFWPYLRYPLPKTRRPRLAADPSPNRHLHQDV